jgi:hypothetical protein
MKTASVTLQKDPVTEATTDAGYPCSVTVSSNQIMPEYSINDPQPRLHIYQFSIPDQPAISRLITTKEAP